MALKTDSISVCDLGNARSESRILVMKRKLMLMLPFDSRSFLRSATLEDPSASSTLWTSVHEQDLISMRHLTNIQRGKAVVLAVPLSILLEANATFEMSFGVI